MFVNVMLPKNSSATCDRKYELTVYDDMVLLERQGVENWEYESMALTKEQALFLASYIIQTYDVNIV